MIERNKNTNQAPDPQSDMDVIIAEIAKEFKNKISNERGMQSLLKTSLECIVENIGLTNAAIFIQTGLDEFSLGGYVNLDMNKDSCEVVLDFLADKVKVLFGEEQAPQSQITDAVPWLIGNDIISHAVIRNGECLAIIVLFRPEQKPFLPDTRNVFHKMMNEFAAPLENVLNIQNRSKFSSWLHRDDENGGSGLSPGF